LAGWYELLRPERQGPTVTAAARSEPPLHPRVVLKLRLDEWLRRRRLRTQAALRAGASRDSASH